MPIRRGVVLVDEYCVRALRRGCNGHLRESCCRVSLYLYVSISSLFSSPSLSSSLFLFLSLSLSLSICILYFSLCLCVLHLSLVLSLVLSPHLSGHLALVHTYSHMMTDFYSVPVPHRDRITLKRCETLPA
jgi:hypothetical protein